MPLLSIASQDEEDILDVAFHVTDALRLSCQIMITPDLNGLRCAVLRALSEP